MSLADRHLSSRVAAEYGTGGRFGWQSAVNRYVEGNRLAWKALEDAYKAGKIRAIGVSNFLEGDIESLWETAEIKPMVNQVLCHISNTPIDLIEFCRKKGIVMEAYSPVAHGEALKNETIAEMAKKYGVTVPQLCIRYDVQLGMIVLPKTANPEHMKVNADLGVCDFWGGYGSFEKCRED